MSDPTQRTPSREAANTPQRMASREAANTPQRTASREAANTPQRTASREALNYATKLLKSSMRELVAEFNEIPNDVSAAQYRSWANNMDKNRYTDVYCLDSTRVRLAWPQGTKDDYIHANRIEGGFPELNNTQLIATQAPLEKTIGDFWRMVWQEKASVIVMLCQLVEEKNKKKADLYWPLEPRQKPIKLDDLGLSIENIGVEEQPEKQMRVSQLRVKGRSSKTGEIREHAVTHVMWRGWPDRDVPASAMNALQLLYNVRGSSNGIVIVHCSAGIGRTGTIIALEIALRRLRAGQEIDVKGIVTKLRKQRYKACQNCHQYLFIHYALLSYLAAKGIVTDEAFNKFKMAYEAIKKN